MVGDFQDTADDAWPLDRLAEEFRALCDDAANVGTRVALELLPFSNIKTPQHGLSLVEAAGARNGGLNVDIWHIDAGPHPLRGRRRAPEDGHRVDRALRCRRNAVVGTMYEDTVHNRRLPGEGDFDIAGFLRAIRATGYDGGYGVEIISEEQRPCRPEEAAKVAYDATMREFELPPGAAETTVGS